MSDGNNEIVGTDQDDRAHLHVGLELGRAAVSDLPASRRSLGRRGELAVRPMDRRQGSGAAAAGPAVGSRARHLSNLSAALDALGWSVHQMPSFATRAAALVSGRSRRAAKMAAPLWEFELIYDLLAWSAGP